MSERAEGSGGKWPEHESQACAKRARAVFFGVLIMLIAQTGLTVAAFLTPWKLGGDPGFGHEHFLRLSLGILAGASLVTSWFLWLRWRRLHWLFREMVHWRYDPADADQGDEEPAPFVLLLDSISLQVAMHILTFISFASVLGVWRLLLSLLLA